MQRRRPRRGVSLFVVDRDLDVELAVRRAAEAFGDLALAGQRAAVLIEPHVVVETDRLDDKRVALPFAGRVAVERRQVHINERRPAVGEDLTESRVALAENDDESWQLDDLLQ